MPLTIHDLKLHILRLVDAESARAGAHIYNTLGRAGEVGNLERALGITFDKEQRAFALQAFRQLETDALIRSTMADFVNPGDWYEITDAGRSALERGLLDDLDEALQAINPHLVGVRRGAWAALESKQPDALSQSAHSGRELIDQVLKEGAPDKTIKEQPWFTPDAGSKSGITRPMRLKYLMLLGAV
jgi:hypothetical protein